ncbi:hypothetical protein AA0488_1024 [Kozakia baliensis NRIC 0488]|nr:hypothetical protein AA0488_1024 [Kozakia baliensis NRIC 0488]
MIVVLDECLDLPFEIAWQIIMLKKHAVLERLMPTLDLPLCLGVVGSAAHVIHVVPTQPFREVFGDVAGAVIR